MVSGGEIVASVLERRGVPFLFSLCGGHISPILVSAKRRGIRVVDVRDEASAVFAAEAVARLTGMPGVAAVTAGPGVTNTVTAIRNAQLAQSPLVLLGGAAATLLKGRGALQDIDQLGLMRPNVKWMASVRRVRDLEETVERAFAVAAEGIPGPVFVECPVDVLYSEELVREWYAVAKRGDGGSLSARVRSWYVDRHLSRLFADARGSPSSGLSAPEVRVDEADVRKAERLIGEATRPVMLIGSQAMLRPEAVAEVADAVDRLGVPAYLSGMARGLLSRDHRLLVRHGRRRALKDADLVILAGVPCDFRLQYGAQIGRGVTLISVNRSANDVRMNRRPALGVVGDPSLFLERLAAGARKPAEPRWASWIDQLAARDREREEEIRRKAKDRSGPYINPVMLLKCIDDVLDDDSVLVLDGGDFVATASYITVPRRPLSFLDPGVFGTLGVGAGFAIGAKLCRPDAEVWIIYGDGAAAYSLAEFDTFVRHGLPVIAVVGNDAGWTQIARGQREALGDDVGTVLLRSDYDRVAEGYGGKGIRIERRAEIEPALKKAKRLAKEGNPVLINALISETDFRAGSISM